MMVLKKNLKKVKGGNRKTMKENNGKDCGEYVP